MRWLRILAGLLLVVCSTKADVTTSSYIRLRDAANQAHRDIPALRRADQQHWRTHVQSTILQAALHEKQQQQQQTRRLEDYYYNRYYTNRADASVQEQVDQQYDATQYGSYGSFEQYGDFQLYDNLWDPSMAETEFGFDITHYSFKYTGCHDVGQRWQQAETRPTRYATFRLCPSDACSGRSTFGCKTNYGEYIVPVDVLVISLIEHNQARVTGYCQYCERCAALESYKQFASEILMHKQYILNYADTRFKSWCSQNGYSSMSESTYKVAAQALWKEMRNGNYATNYVSKSNGYANPSTYANGESRQSWNFQTRNGMSWEYPDEQKSWQSMGYTFGSWYDRTIYPGYYDSSGNFNTCWGYNSDEGFVCLDTTDDTVYWDKSIFGTLPYKWSNFTQNGFIVDQEDYCDSRYSSSCYNQYDACMEILGETTRTSYAAANAKKEKRLSLSTLLHCTNITEDLMQYNALSFYSQWVYAQAKNRQYDDEIEEYNNEMMRNGYLDSVYNYIDTPEPGLYVGPSCGRDSMTIKLAVYGDPNCTSRVKEISVQELLGYDPLSDDTNIFPNDCISCSPPEDEIIWYETEVVDNPVLPFCSMLYQLAGKCNLGLHPSGRYDPERLYASDDNVHFLVGAEPCALISTLNKKHQRRQSFLKKWTDGVRMTQKAISPLTRATFFVLIILLSGVGVAAFLMKHMKEVQLRIAHLRKQDPGGIPDIPTFGYQTLGMDRKESGIGKARGEQWRRPPVNQMARSRTSPNVTQLSR